MGNYNNKTVPVPFIMTNNEARSANSDADYHIDEILISPREGVIVRGGETFKVAPRAIQLLAYLIQHAGRPITHAEINEAIWDNGCSENSFYQQVASLRKALGEDSAQPRYIKTIAKQGYMFIAADAVHRPQTAERGASARATSARRLLLVALAAVLLLALGLAILLPERDPRAELYSLADELVEPAQVIVVERPLLADPAQQSLLNAAALIAQYHLRAKRTTHVALVHRFTRSGVSSDGQFYRKLSKHYGDKLQAVYRPALALRDDHWQLRLARVNPTLAEASSWVDVERDSAPLALAEFERQLVAQLPAGVDRQLLLAGNAEADQWFIESLQHLFKADKTRANLQQTIRLSQRATDLNPNNLLAYSVLWSELVKLVSIYSDYDIGQVLKRLDRTLAQAQQVAPEYHRALYMAADRHCWLAEYSRCAKGMRAALNADPFDPYTLDSLYWNLNGKSDLQLKVARHNYQLNPFYHDAFADLRDALLASGNLHDISDAAAYHAQWSDSSDWFVQAQRDTTLDLLLRQADYYRAHYLQRAGELQEAALLPSRYLGYSLLNANRPDLAEFWARNGRERDLPYFDLRVIELLANLWRGQWQPLKWQVERAYVMERESDQNALDKLTIAYFDYYSGWLPKAAAMLEQLHPALLDEDPVIDSGNVRLFIYYSEIQKRLSNLKYANRTGEAIKRYLQSREEGPRGIDFGIADVEFYALNDNIELALDRLEQAVYQQSWLPNSLWLWPPLDHNLHLKSLQAEPRFVAVRKHIAAQLAKVCFDAECPAPE